MTLLTNSATLTVLLEEEIPANNEKGRSFKAKFVSLGKDKTWFGPNLIIVNLSDYLATKHGMSAGWIGTLVGEISFDYNPESNARYVTLNAQFARSQAVVTFGDPSGQDMGFIDAANTVILTGRLGPVKSHTTSTGKQFHNISLETSNLYSKENILKHRLFTSVKFWGPLPEVIVQNIGRFVQVTGQLVGNYQKGTNERFWEIGNVLDIRPVLPLSLPNNMSGVAQTTPQTVPQQPVVDQNVNTMGNFGTGAMGMGTMQPLPAMSMGGFTTQTQQNQTGFNAVMGGGFQTPSQTGGIDNVVGTGMGQTMQQTQGFGAGFGQVPDQQQPVQQGAVPSGFVNPTGGATQNQGMVSQQTVPTTTTFQQGTGQSTVTQSTPTQQVPNQSGTQMQGVDLGISTDVLPF